MGWLVDCSSGSVGAVQMGVFGYVRLKVWSLVVRAA